jgi:hypothetical protein
MIINSKDADSRLNSPMNLINKLRASTGSRNSAMSLFGVGRSVDKQIKQVEFKPQSIFNPFTKTETVTDTQTQAKTDTVIDRHSDSQSLSPKPILDNILENHESQIKLGLAHDQALDLLNRSVSLLSTKLDDVRADKLSSVISAASKTVESIRKERNEASKNSKDREVHYHFYTPTQKVISDYEVIDVT